MVLESCPPQSCFCARAYCQEEEELHLNSGDHEDEQLAVGEKDRDMCSAVGENGDSIMVNTIPTVHAIYYTICY